MIEGVRSRSRGTLSLLLLAATALAVLSSGCRTIRAARILRDSTRPAYELAEGVDEEEVLVGSVAVRVHRPADESGPWPALLLVHGAVEGGARDPRFVALARALARQGFLVACPELQSLSSFRADPGDVEHIVAVTHWLAEATERGDQPLSLAGISIGGSYCLVAAARPEVRESVAAVLAFGAYEDLERLVTSWLVAPARDAPGLYDPLVEGRRRVLLGNVDGLVPAAEREALRHSLAKLVRGGEVGDEAAAELGPAGRRVLECARSTAPVDPATAAAVLAPLRADMRALSPGGDGNTPTARIFLLHGEADPIVPPSETELLEARLEEEDARVRSHVTGVFTHVAAGKRGSFFASWALARFLAGFLQTAGR